MIKQEEILSFMKQVENEDILGVMRNDCENFLEYVNVKSFLKPGITEELWNNKYRIKSDADILQIIKDYLPFAWDKNEREISAGRSVQHFRTLIYLYGDMDFYKKITDMEDNDYAPYGKPILKAVEEWLKNKMEEK